MAVPYTFGTATASIPLSQLDSNFATAITLGNTAIQLGNTVTTLNNMTLANVTISSGELTLTNVSATTANVTTANVVTMIVTGNETVQGNTTVTGTITGAKLIPTGTSVTGNGMYLPATNAVGISTAGINAVYVNASQNVGIGTTSPSAKLSVSDTANPKINLLVGSVERAFINYTTSTTTASFDSDGDITFSPNNTEAARVNSSGNLLVGATSAGGRVTINPASNAQYGAWIESKSTGDVGNSMLVIAKYDNNTTTSQIFAQFRVNTSTLSGYITANGANAATFTSSSDERLKENIVNLPSQLNNLMSLRPVEFDFKDGSGHQIGFIAQEMQTVYPDVVAQGVDKYLMVSGWSKTEARLVKAIQEQQALITSLTDRIAALEAV